MGSKVCRLGGGGAGGIPAGSLLIVSYVKDTTHADNDETSSATQSQLVRWPPMRNYRKNNIQAKKAESASGMYILIPIG
ncbi:PB1 domain, AUX/IAA protein [Artemisia annua]|uniref:Auxin-responsive protein n=1 Tax=Artemisia annua TaxID=35608 RepID=A0A2U1KVF7_ARTAN|nr:PB1 domain, AUX/IAA protein [Artemisia annua]